MWTNITMLSRKHTLRTHSLLTHPTLTHHTPSTPSGTEKQHVANDYAKRLHRGQAECTSLLNEVIGGHMKSKSGGAAPDLQYCEYLNISVCSASSDGDSVSVLYIILMSFWKLSLTARNSS